MTKFQPRTISKFRSNLKEKKHIFSYNYLPFLRVIVELKKKKRNGVNANEFAVHI